MKVQLPTASITALALILVPSLGVSQGEQELQHTTAVSATPRPVGSSFARSLVRPDDSASGEDLLSAPARVAFDGAPLVDALRRLESSSGIRIAYSPSLLPTEKRVTCECDRATVSEVLSTILRGTASEFVVAADHVVIRPVRNPEVRPISIGVDADWSFAANRIGIQGTLTPPPSREFQGTITGQVVDRDSGSPLASVQIYISGIDIGVLTQGNGRYILQNVPTGTHTLTVERLGYRTQTREVTVSEGETHVHNFELRQEALALEEIVVTGTAGQARRREIGNAVSQINVAQDVSAPPTNVETLLQGRVAGLQVSQSGGSMGDGSRIRLRGNASVSLGNEPLIYIDGIRINNDAYPTIAPENLSGNQYSSYQAPSPLNDLNPSNIERIEVVNGPAATTLYGTEAASGVIQIFTKKGTEGDATVEVQIDQGVKIAQPHGPRKTLRGTPIEDFEGTDVYRSPGGGNAPDGGTPKYWFLEPWLQEGHTQKYNVSARGGTSDMRYSLSGFFEQGDGILVSEWQERKGIRGNVGFSLTPDLNIDWNTTYKKNSWETIGTGNYQWGLLMAAARGERNYWGTNDYETLNRAVTEHTFEQRIDRLITGGRVTHTPFGGFSQVLDVGYDLGVFEGLVDVTYGSLAAPEGYRQKNVTEQSVLTVDYRATYEHELADGLQGSFSVGGQRIDREERQHRGWAGDFPGPGLLTLNAGGRSLAREERQRVVTGGVFGQTRFGYMDRYFLTLGLRVDGNSAFGADFGWAPYPKVSGSYVISDEAFWPDDMGRLRLRAAYGHAGRAPGAFDAVRTWNPISWGNQVAYMPRVPGNPELGPERTAELELGFNGAWFDGRLSADFTYYRQNTTDALLSVALPASKGPWQSQLENIGKIKNSGIELSLNGDIIEGSVWNWNAGVSLSTNHSEMLDMGEQDLIWVGGEEVVTEGQPVPAVKADKILNPDEIAAPEVDRGHVFGPNHPTLIVSPSMRFRLPYGIVVSAHGEFQGGYYMASGADEWAHRTGARSPHCFDAHALMREGKADQLTAKERAWCQRTTLVNESFIYPADFFKLRTVSVRIPLDFATPQGIDASLTLSGNNTYRWLNEDFRAWDPENGGWFGGEALYQGIWEHPAPPRIINSSVRVSF